MANIKERILQFLELKGVVVSKFFPEIGISYSGFKGPQLHSSPSSAVLAKIKSRFPDLNIDWLLSGEGNMLVQQHESSTHISDKFFEKISISFERLNTGQLAIIEQNGEIIKINQEILHQNSELIKQHADAMEIIKKLSEKL